MSSDPQALAGVLGSSGLGETLPPGDGQDPLLGSVIADRLQLTALLGAGACGKVFRARHLLLDHDLAIKVLHRGSDAHPQLALRFQAEARAASRLDHPNSVRILDFGEDRGLLYIAMELLEGEDLQTTLAREGPLGSLRAARIVAQVCAALTVAHRQGIVHRDLKPGNIMLVTRRTEDELVRDVVKVCDFGLAKLLDAAPEELLSAPITLQNAIIGTPSYMSPEQASGTDIDARTDLYACGVLMFEMLAGRPPFTGEGPAQILVKQILDEPPPLQELAPGADPRLVAIAHRALAKRREDRFQSAREMLLALRAVLGGAELERMQLRTPSTAGWDPPPPAHPVEATIPAAVEGPGPTLLDALPAASRAPRVSPAWLGLAAALAAVLALVLLVPRLRAPQRAAAARVEAQSQRARSIEPAPPVELERSEPRAAPEGERPPSAPGVAEPPRIEPPQIEPRPVERASATRRARRPAPSPAPAMPVHTASAAAAPRADPVPEAQPDPPIRVAEAAPPEPEPLQPAPARIEPPSPPASPPRPALELVIADLQVSGGLTHTRCAAALRRSEGALKACFDAASIATEVRVRARIASDGVLRVRALSGGAAPLGECVSAALEGTRMPRPDTGEAQLTFRLRSSPR